MVSIESFLIVEVGLEIEAIHFGVPFMCLAQVADGITAHKKIATCMSVVVGKLRHCVEPWYDCPIQFTTDARSLLDISSVVVLCIGCCWWCGRIGILCGRSGGEMMSMCEGDGQPGYDGIACICREVLCACLSIVECRRRGQV